MCPAPMERFVAVCVLLMALINCHSVNSQAEVEQLVRRARKLAPEIFRRTRELIVMKGYPMEEHTVQTEDGYLLTIFRIPPRSNTTTKLPVFLQHGLSVSSEYWVLTNTNRSLAFTLADLGYDVWLGNIRGNMYCRKHISLKTEDPAFWKFSFHEMGTYDIPAMLDHVLKTTEQDSLYYVGYSMGNTMMYVTLTMLPEYNSKVRLLVSLAPAIFLSHTQSLLGRDFLANYGIFKGVVDSGQADEILPSSRSDELAAFLYYLCRDGSTLQKVCEDFLFQTAGESNGLNRSEISTILSHFHPASSFTLLHFLQMIKSGRFEQMSYGVEKNQMLYGSSQPPQYDLRKLIAPVSFHYSEGDNLVDPEDAEHLLTQLPNVVEVRKVPSSHFNHLDFLMHTDVKRLLNDHLVTTLERY